MGYMEASVSAPLTTERPELEALCRLSPPAGLRWCSSSSGCPAAPPRRGDELLLLLLLLLLLGVRCRSSWFEAGGGPSESG